MYVWASWLTLERKNSGFRDLSSQGREKLVSMIYWSRIRAKRTRKKGRSERNVVSEAFTLGCDSHLENLVATKGHTGSQE